MLGAAIAGLAGCGTLARSPSATGVAQASYESEAAADESSSITSTLDRTVKELTGKAVKPEEARRKYAEAETLYGQAMQLKNRRALAESREKFAQAAKQFQAAAKLWPDSALHEDALFHAAESYFFADRYPDANEVYERLVKDYPNTRYQDVVQARRFAIARYWLQRYQADPQSWYVVNLGDESRPFNDLKGHALRILGKIPLDDPTGKLADDAILAQANEKFLAGRYDEADRFYDDLRTMYPTSEHQFTAHLMGIKTKLLRYQGPEYDGTALEEAEKLIEQVRVQFPQEAQANATLLDRAAREVRYRRAEREWYMAKFYDRRKDYGAAKFYYQIVRRDYHETPFAQRAETRLAQISSYPDVPPQRLEWLVKWFPSSEPETPLLRNDSATTRR